MAQHLMEVPRKNKRELFYVFYHDKDNKINYNIYEFKDELNNLKEQRINSLFYSGFFKIPLANSFEEAERNRKKATDIFLKARQYTFDCMREKLEELKVL